MLHKFSQLRQESVNLVSKLFSVCWLAFFCLLGVFLFIVVFWGAGRGLGCFSWPVNVTDGPVKGRNTNLTPEVDSLNCREICLLVGLFVFV